MKTYPIALELTVWVEMGIHQYEITIDEISTLSAKRTDDVLRSRELSVTEVGFLIEAIGRVGVPVLENVSAPSNQASSSYELIIESAHFSVEFNWENLDLESDQTGSLVSISSLAEIIEDFGQAH
ncbi:hypothetical protein SAMN06295945_0912 [Polynucleobacter meluiroseus]|uniref:Uncharacterized protein n=1 Tax=Polynucleobacter meluiroseus TaxID=1938814 RepID=A0A240E142_9BURK|nr:hypothetical protein [Polynucleobacter meluiroseus]SNX28580.1 hypothetical protein SAMN06295945_0912 [Polynucleobacter meluiroseus]